MSERSSSDPVAWYGPRTMSAFVLKASKRSSASSIQVISQMSQPRTFILLTTPSVNLRAERLSESTTTTGVLSSYLGTSEAASSNGAVLPQTMGRTPRNHDSDAVIPCPGQEAKIAGISMNLGWGNVYNAFSGKPSLEALNL